LFVCCARCPCIMIMFHLSDPHPYSSSSPPSIPIRPSIPHWVASSDSHIQLHLSYHLAASPCAWPCAPPRKKKEPKPTRKRKKKREPQTTKLQKGKIKNDKRNENAMQYVKDGARQYLGMYSHCGAQQCARVCRVYRNLRDRDKGWRGRAESQKAKTDNNNTTTTTIITGTKGFRDGRKRSRNKKTNEWYAMVVPWVIFRISPFPLAFQRNRHSLNLQSVTTTSPTAMRKTQKRKKRNRHAMPCHAAQPKPVRIQTRAGAVGDQGTLTENLCGSLLSLLLLFNLSPSPLPVDIIRR